MSLAVTHRVMARSHDAPMTHPTFVPVPRQPPILRRLSLEWEHRTIRAADLRHVHSWHLPGDEVASLDDVLDRCGFTRRVETGPRPNRRDGHDPGMEARYDAYLLHLLVLARTDELAGRIVLQRILPALSGIARRHTARGLALHDLLDDLVANAWTVIRTYPVDRRPRRVVANLVRDVGFQTIVRPTRRSSSTEVATSHDRMGETEVLVEPSPLAELVDLLREARRLEILSEADLELICQLVTLGRPEHLAAVRQVSARTVRNHRDAIVHRLRHLAGAA